MSEITNFADKNVFTQQDKFIENLRKANTEMSQMAKSFDTLTQSTRKNVKSEKDLDAVSKEGNKLLKQREALTAKQDKRLQELTTQVIKAKEAEKKRLAAIKESITGEKAAVEAKKRSVLAEKEKIKQLKQSEQATKKAAVEEVKRASIEKKAALQRFKNSKEGIRQTLKEREARKQLILEQKKELGILPKRNGLFKSMTKSILAAGAAMFTFSGAITLAKKGLEVLFLGTQSNIDFFRIKLAGVRAEIEVLRDRFAKFGEELRKNEVEKTTKKLTVLEQTFKALLGGKAAGVIAANLFFKDLNQEMREVGNAAEELEKRMIILERATANLSLQNAVRRRGIQELIFVTRKETVSFDERMEALKAANKLELEIINSQKENQRERIAIALAEQNITDEQIEQIALRGLTLEQVGLTLTKEEERQTVVTEITKFYEIQTLSLAKQRELQNRVNELKNKQLSEEKKIRDQQIAQFLAKNKEVDKITEDEKFIHDLEEQNHNDILKWIKEEEDAEAASLERRKALREQVLTSTQEFGNVLFDLGQTQRDRELADLESNYDKKIQLAEGDTELQEKLAAELEQKRKKIAYEQAKSERNQALFNIALNTAQAIAKVWAQTGVAGPIAQVAPIAMGLLQTGLVLSQPLPAFFKGTSDTPFAFTAGEKGRELMIKNDGSVELTPGNTTAYAGKEYEHATILPNQQTERILSGQSSQPSNARLERKLDQVVWAIQKNKPNINISRNMPRVNVNHHKRKYGLN